MQPYSPSLTMGFWSSFLASRNRKWKCMQSHWRNGISCSPWFLWKQRRIYTSMQASSLSRHIHIAYFSAEEVESIKVVDFLTWVLSEFVRRAKILWKIRYENGHSCTLHLCWTFCTGVVIWHSCLRRFWFQLSNKIKLIRVLIMVTFMKQTPFWTKNFYLMLCYVAPNLHPSRDFVNLNDIKNCKTFFFLFFL